MTIKLSNRELATVLAALRYWQQNLAVAAGQDGTSFSPDHFDEVNTPLTVEEIDDLSERLNCGPSAE
jgi:hypothetical protein